MQSIFGVSNEFDLRVFGRIYSVKALFTVEGIIDHHILGIHHVNETVDRAYWIYWDIGFTLSGIIMMIAGWLLVQQGDHESAVAMRPS